MPRRAAGRSFVKKTLLNLAKFAFSAGIIAYLVYKNQEAFEQLHGQPKDWGLFALAWLVSLAAVMLTFVRWFVLVRALDLSFSMKDAFRLGFLGYLLNFISLGSVGGDLFKSVFVAREQPGRRAEAVATVVLDRVVGLYMLFVMGSVAILATGQLSSTDEKIQFISRATLICTGLGLAGILALLVPGVTRGRFSAFLERMPRLGPIFGRLLGAIRIYRSRLTTLVLAAALSVVVHGLSAIGVYLAARALPGQVPPLVDHFVIVPLAFVTGVLPLPANGLGALEYVVDFLYERVPAGIAIAKGRGLVVALGYRVITILIAMVGVGYYLASRREVVELLHEAEADAESGETACCQPARDATERPASEEPAVGVS